MRLVLRTGDHERIVPEVLVPLSLHYLVQNRERREGIGWLVQVLVKAGILRRHLILGLAPPGDSYQGHRRTTGPGPDTSACFVAIELRHTNIEQRHAQFAARVP